MSNKEKKEVDLSILDEMLEEHEKFKEYYGKKYSNLSEEEKLQKQLEELEQVEYVINQTGMDKDTIKLKKR